MDRHNNRLMPHTVATNLANKTLPSSTQGIQEWSVPQTGKYKIEAFGARGARWWTEAQCSSW